LIILILIERNDETPLVINTGGFIMNVGEIILLDLINIIKPNDIIFLKENSANEKI
jgi:polynucleotide 5'-kinase involved in rRNA processing